MDLAALKTITELFPPGNVAPSTKPAQHAQPTAQPRPPQPDRVTISTRRTAETPAPERSNPGVLERLRARDRDVRAHEQAHLARAGGLAKAGPQYKFQRGPDGKLYAIGGTLQLDASPVPGNPQATIQKARQIRAAALAPARPSAQDRAVAAAATRMETQARVELEQQRPVSGRPAGQVGSASSSETVFQGRHLDVYA